MKKILTGALLAGVVISSIFIAGACSSPKVKTDNERSIEASESAKRAYELSLGETGNKDDKQPDPTTPQVVKVSIYVPGTNGITQNMDNSIDILDPELLFAKLIELNIVDKNAKLKSFTITNDKGVLSLSGVDINNKQLMKAIANTYIDNFEELLYLTIEVDGKSSADTKDMKFDKEFKKSGNVKVNKVSAVNENNTDKNGN